MSKPLLVELYTEELPPKALKKLGETFASGIAAGLKQRGLLDKDDCTVYATPRRLAVLFAAVLDRGADRPVEEKLMPLAVARGPDGKASPALDKKLAASGRAALAKLFPDGRDGADAFVIKKDGKAEFVYLQTLALGQPLARALEEAIAEAIEKLPIPKVMTYQLPDGITTVKFVRPAHGLVVLHGTEVVAVSALGLDAGRLTYGHRFLGQAEIELAAASDYETALKESGKVIASFEGRRSLIENQLLARAKELGAGLGDYAGLLDEVTALVEWPVVYVAEFDPAFLEVPQECLILTMRTNQKYFPLFDATGKLTHRFLIVSNMQVADPVNIISGNQRVVRPRLEDARFFYNQDRRERLETRVPRLGKVVYHNKLGTQLERVARVQLLAGKIARLLNVDAAQAERAAWLAKADLVTGMVGEFPELQGVMGRYYAQHDGEPQVVAEAIAEHYLPRYAGDQLPQGQISCAVALADKLDTIIGIFGTGAIPTGDKDPFALRRHALGIIRILAEKQLPLDPKELLQMAHENFPAGTLIAAHDRGEVSIPNPLAASLFVDERAKSYLRDLGYSALEVESVLSLSPLPTEYVLRLKAARKFLTLPESAGLAEADKRIRNILAKSGGLSVIALTNESGLQLDEEKVLLRTTRLLRAQVDTLLAQAKFDEALLLTAQLHTPVSQFFDKVMVNVDDPELRKNRFALLHEVSNLTNRVADISKLAA